MIIQAQKPALETVQPRSGSVAAGRRGFTLIEMIGVLAIISILASVLLPRVFKAVADAQINSIAQSVQGVKAAVVDYYAENGTFPDPNRTVDGDAEDVEDDGSVEQMLIQANLLEQLFEAAIGTDSGISTVPVDSAASAPFAAGDQFDLDGTGSGDCSGRVVRAMVAGVSQAEAEDLDRRIDGDPANYGDGTIANSAGRVAWDNTGYPTTVYIYLAHR